MLYFPSFQSHNYYKRYKELNITTKYKRKRLAKIQKLNRDRKHKYKDYVKSVKDK